MEQRVYPANKADKKPNVLVNFANGAPHVQLKYNEEYNMPGRKYFFAPKTMEEALNHPYRVRPIKVRFPDRGKEYIHGNISFPTVLVNKLVRLTIVGEYDEKTKKEILYEDKKV